MKRVVILALSTGIRTSAFCFRAAQLPPVSTSGPSLVFSTFLGGSKVKSTYGTAVARDKKGGLLITGRTQA